MRPSKVFTAFAATLAVALGACGAEEHDLDVSAATLSAGSVYSDALASGWADWSWAAHNLANTSPIWSGTRSISVTYGAWQGLYFHSAGTSTSGLTHLELQVNGGATAGPVLGAYVTVAGVQKPIVTIAQYCDGGSIPANAWTRCRVPLSALGAANASVDGIVLKEYAGRSLPPLYFDDIQLAGAPTLPSAPTGLTATAAAASVSIAWTADPASTGYQVYRATAQAGPFTRLTATAVASPSYVDTAVTAGTTYWYAVSGVNAAGEGARSAAVGATVPAAVTVPSVAVYSDALASGWADWSWAAHNLANTSPIWSGTRSISVTYGAWQGLYFHSGGVSTSGLTHLELQVNGGATAGPVLGAYVTVAGVQKPIVTIAQHCDGGSIPANAWTRCRVPLSALGAANASVDGIVLKEYAGRSLPPLYFDEVKLTGASAPPPAPPPPPPAPTISVVVSPATASVAAGGTKQFTATVSGTTNTTVTWTIQEGAAGGSVNSTGLYTAPSAAGTYHVVARSAADSTKSAVATVTVTASTPPPATVSVSMNPATATLVAGGTLQLSATVSGTTNTGVTWTIQEGATGGSVSSTGLYTAPSAAGTYHVVATSVVDPTKSAVATVTVTAPAPPPGGGSTDTTGIISADRRTTWNPGIPGGIPTRTTTCATVTPAYASGLGLTAFATNGTGNAQPAIQYALDHCPAGQVVYLPAGTYRVNSAIEVKTGVTLRGAGKTQTKIRAYSGDAVIYMWPGGWPWYDASWQTNVVGDVPKDATTITVASAANFSVGDIIQLDQTDDTSYLFYGGCPWFKRPDYGPPTSAPRSQGTTLEITGKSGNVLTVTPPVHLRFTASHSPQIFKANATLKYAGIEDLYVTGGQSGNIHMLATAYSWVKGVESDGTVSSNPASDGTLGQGNGMSGDHLLIERSFRVVVRDSYFHHATHVVQGGNAYGISLSQHTSDSLIENNIVHYMNKPLTMRATGGGNVIAYNYIDNAWTSADDRLQETTIDLGHASFPFMELVEGNWAAQIATEDVWGNSGWMTIFRNYASGQQQRTAQFETYEITAISLQVKAINMNVVGNVLGTAGKGMVYEVHSNPPGAFQAAVFRLGEGVNAGSGNGDMNTYESPTAPGSTASMLLRVGNWDAVRNQVDSVPAAQLPASLYLTSKPAFFGANPWPWVDPAGGTKTYVLPAKQRFDAGTP